MAKRRTLRQLTEPIPSMVGRALDEPRSQSYADVIDRGTHDEEGGARMRRQVPIIVAVAALALGSVACGEEDREDAEREARRTATTVQERVEEATRLTANLSGDAEVPRPGDPDGTGTATVNIDATKGEVCYEVTVRMIDRPTGMHIHEGEAGESGPVVVPLTAPTASDATSSDCVEAEDSLIGRITARPGDFYVNVHTATYPEGAVRGQLSQ